MAELNLFVTPAQVVPLTVGDSDSVSLSVAESATQNPTYTGQMTVTPSQSTQTLSTSGYVMPGNVTVNPIPSDWGHITWNGSVLTVS